MRSYKIGKFKARGPWHTYGVVLLVAKDIGVCIRSLILECMVAIGLQRRRRFIDVFLLHFQKPWMKDGRIAIAQECKCDGDILITQMRLLHDLVLRYTRCVFRHWVRSFLLNLAGRLHGLYEYCMRLPLVSPPRYYY